MAVVVGRMLAVLEAQTAQFQARMDAAAQQLNRWNSATGSARRGTQLMRVGFEQLAMKATGLTGPLGKVVTSLGLMGAGGPVTLGVLAGVGAIALVYQGMTRDAREAQKATDDLIASLDKMGAHAQVLAARIKLGRAQTATGEGQGAGGVGSQFLSDISGGLFGVSGPEQSERRKRAVAAAQNELAAAQQHAANVEAAAQRRRNAELQKQAEITERVRRVNEDLARLRLGPLTQSELTLHRLTPGAQIPIRFGGRVVDPRNLPEATQRTTAPAPDRFKMTPEFAIMSSMALLQGAQGGPAGLFGAAAGPLAMINPLAGAISAGIGGIFSLFDNAEERRHRQLVDTIKKLGQEVGLERVTVIFTGPDGHQVRKSLAELEEGDAVERVPGPVGAGG